MLTDQTHEGDAKEIFLPEIAGRFSDNANKHLAILVSPHGHHQNSAQRELFG